MNNTRICTAQESYMDQAGHPMTMSNSPIKDTKMNSKQLIPQLPSPMHANQSEPQLSPRNKNIHEKANLEPGYTLIPGASQPMVPKVTRPELT